jgi:hypothetical protein
MMAAAPVATDAYVMANEKTLRTLASRHGVKLVFFRLHNHRPHLREPELAKVGP